MPKVSIIMPTYKRRELIARAVNSVLAQTYQDWELIIVDDCPEQSAENVVKNFNDARIIYLKHEKNRGGAAARNTGIRKASGEFIAFLDDDDEWLPQKLEVQMKKFKDTPPSVGFCFASAYAMTKKGRQQKIIPDGVADYHERALKSFNGFLGVTVIVKKAVLDNVGLWDEAFPSHQEVDLIIRITKKYKGLAINQPLVLMSLTGEHEHIGTDFKKRIAGRKMILEKHLSEFQKYPKILAGHYFQLGIFYRDDKQYHLAKERFRMALKADFRLRYFVHYVIMLLKGA